MPEGFPVRIRGCHIIFKGLIIRLHANIQETRLIAVWEILWLEASLTLIICFVTASSHDQGDFLNEGLSNIDSRPFLV